MELFDRAKAWITKITELGLLLVALGIVLQMLFGDKVAFFGDIVGNVMKLVSTLGSNGVVGLVAIAVILYLFNRKKPLATTRRRSWTWNGSIGLGRSW